MNSYWMFWVLNSYGTSMALSIPTHINLQRFKSQQFLIQSQSQSQSVYCRIHQISSAQRNSYDLAANIYAVDGIQQVTQITYTKITYQKRKTVAHRLRSRRPPTH